MAEIFLGAFVNALVEKLVSGDLWNFARTERIGTQLTKWKSMLAQVQAVVADAEEKQITDLDEFRGLMYDMEDVLDEFMFEALRRQGMVRKLIFKTKGVRKLSFKMDEITARLQALFNQTMVFGSKIIDEKHGIRFNTPFDDSCFCVDFFNATSAEGEPLIGSARLPVRDLVLGERAVRKKLVVTCPSGRPIGEVTVMLAVRRVENPLPPEKTVTVVYEERAVDDFDEDDLT